MKRCRGFGGVMDPGDSWGRSAPPPLGSPGPPGLRSLEVSGWRSSLKPPIALPSPRPRHPVQLLWGFTPLNVCWDGPGVTRQVSADGWRVLIRSHRNRLPVHQRPGLFSVARLCLTIKQEVLSSGLLLVRLVAPLSFHNSSSRRFMFSTSGRSLLLIKKSILMNRVNNLPTKLKTKGSFSRLWQ